MKQILKYLSFGTLGIIVSVLILATVVENMYGTLVAVQYIYTSPWMVAFWTLLSFSALGYIIISKIKKATMAFMLHISFLIILCGAMVTHLFGIQGKVRLRVGMPATTVYTLSDGQIGRFPFAVGLEEFRFRYYKGTFAPMDYVNTLRFVDGTANDVGQVTMNNIYSYNGWRFYQSGYDADGKGTTLIVSYDPYGIGITYAGYIMLLISMIGFFFQKKSYYKRMLNSSLLRKGILTFLLLLCLPLASVAGNSPRTVPQNVAEKFGRLYVYYNDRICPMQTLARDFTIKIYGKDSYKGLSAEQILTGWILYYDTWKDEPMIRVKEKSVQHILDVGDYASHADFTSVEGYKLQDALKNSRDDVLRRAAGKANEKFNLVSMVASGSFIKIYPYAVNGMTPVWYSYSDNLPGNIPVQQWTFIKNSMAGFAEMVALGQYEQACAQLDSIIGWQRMIAGDVLPSDTRIAAERMYNSLSPMRMPAILCTLLGIISFVVYCRYMTATMLHRPVLERILFPIIVVIFLYLTLLMALRGFIGNHLPLSNGYETMIFLAWSALLFTISVKNKLYMAVPFGLTLCGLSLLVAMMGESNPQITLLMPVLQSPLLSIHVVVIMFSYSLFAFAMLNGITAVVLYFTSGDIKRIEILAVISRLMLYPAVFLLAAGIFIGAVWANVSWGRYWGWDPKEVWALITMLVYSLVLHSGSIPQFRNPLFVHIYCIIAFITVLITYFGVNFVLGGMHSYA